MRIDLAGSQTGSSNDQFFKSQRENLLVNNLWCLLNARPLLIAPWVHYFGIWKSDRYLDMYSLARQINVQQNFANVCPFLVFLGNSYFEKQFVCDKAVKLSVFSTLLSSCPFSLHFFVKYIRFCGSILCL